MRIEDVQYPEGTPLDQIPDWSKREDLSITDGMRDRDSALFVCVMRDGSAMYVEHIGTGEVCWFQVRRDGEIIEGFDPIRNAAVCVDPDALGDRNYVKES